MTHQNNPNDKPESDSALGRGPRGNYMRRADGNWNMMPLILGACAVAVIGYMFLDRAPEPSTEIGIERPASAVTPKTAPVQPN
jgi:hypothetical protein